MPRLPPTGYETKCDLMELVALVDLEFLRVTLPLQAIRTVPVLLDACC
jgi:hypothetical protein